ncbi:methyltransferase domain-containing protein [Actinomadura sp. DC4]|uniref:protein-L-isoaspartate O-methyltransferase family protein n=1 Tax=Actinomadura sp. DC4 TaxID=3055069 RepID=UPI0025B055A2|nr:methyltransferase domain-containing protein [Actinomadura sp. DC4]MDN3358810.1 methyltransferase domain-containing protein [Actinomadura sp. DC4]
MASDEAITTQLKDGMWPTSSSSAPWVMAQMIDALKLRPGLRVLEIGTGTGYNAACMAEAGAEVVSVEIDERIAEQARRNLRISGHSGVEVITGDGEDGAPRKAPFDRVISTGAAQNIPYAWVGQTRDGGLIVLPYTGEAHEGAMVVLSVRDGVATGDVQGEAIFMPLRGQRIGQRELQALDSRKYFQIEVSRSGQRITTD